jgi:hypothetical protein
VLTLDRGLDLQLGGLMLGFTKMLAARAATGM